MHLTDGWIVVLIVVVACVLIFSISFYIIPYEDDEIPEEKYRGRRRK